jgi:hypothetical protein
LAKSRSETKDLFFLKKLSSTFAALSLNNKMCCLERSVHGHGSTKSTMHRHVNARRHEKTTSNTFWKHAELLKWWETAGLPASHYSLAVCHPEQLRVSNTSPEHDNFFFLEYAKDLRIFVFKKNSFYDENGNWCLPLLLITSSNNMYFACIRLQNTDAQVKSRPFFFLEQSKIMKWRVCHLIGIKVS